MSHKTGSFIIPRMYLLKNAFVLNSNVPGHFQDMPSSSLQNTGWIFKK